MEDSFVDSHMLKYLALFDDPPSNQSCSVEVDADPFADADGPFLDSEMFGYLASFDDPPANSSTQCDAFLEVGNIDPFDEEGDELLAMIELPGEKHPTIVDPPLNSSSHSDADLNVTSNDPFDEEGDKILAMVELPRDNDQKSVGNLKPNSQSRSDIEMVLKNSEVDDTSFSDPNILMGIGIKPLQASLTSYFVEPEVHRSAEVLKLNGSRFEIIQNDGRGDCLFLSASQFIFGSQFNHLDVRKNAVDHVVQNWDEFKINAVEQHSEFSRSKRGWVKDPKNTYKYYVSQRGIMGTYAEVYALSQYYKIRIEIYQKMTNSFRHEEFGSGERTLYLLFIGDYKRGHWQMLKKLYN